MHKTFSYWSYSQWSTYRKCPLWARLRYLDHEPEPPDPTYDERRERGKRLHKNIENFIDGKEPYLTPEVSAFEGTLTDARELKAAGCAVEVEKVTYLDQFWRQTTAANKWLVFVPDLKVVVPGEINLACDHKSGKKFGNEVSHYAQIELYSVAAWRIDDSFDEYKGEVWYLDQRDVVKHKFFVPQLERAFARIDKEVDRMMNDKLFRPQPNKINCRYCPFSPRGSGVCPVGV
jgi:CRISPR/Cas system-associated exonuclease Cas4 (RecB family)